MAGVAYPLSYPFSFPERRMVTTNYVFAWVGNVVLHATCLSSLRGRIFNLLHEYTNSSRTVKKAENVIIQLCIG